MGDPATLIEPAASVVVTAIPTVIAAEMQDGAKIQSANKNGKKSESGSSGTSFFTWFIVLALLGVWTSVAVVYFDLVDYQGVLGKLVAYDTDGDGDFDVEDAKVLLDEKPGDGVRMGAKKETPTTKDVGLKLREALKQQLAIIHERVEAKKLAKLALAEVRHLLAKEEEEKELELGRKEITARVKERVASRLKEEEDKMEKEEMEKALERLGKEKDKQGEDEKRKEGRKEDGGTEKKTKKREEKEEMMEGEGKEAKSEDKERGKEKKKKSKADKSDKGKK